MKSVIAILLAGIFMIQSASRLLIIANYEVNKEYISKNLCENKAKPKMHCNGKCHLKKQLQKEDKKENSASNSMKEKLEIQFFSDKASSTKEITETTENKLNSNYLFGNYSKHLAAVFHPPQA